MGDLPLFVHPDARVEALEAHEWYSQRSQRAADAFQDEFQDARRAIQHSPELWAYYLFGTRRYVMKRFPFAIVYRVAEERIEIVAVAHGRRKPGLYRYGSCTA